jgi:hypothetical protein
VNVTAAARAPAAIAAWAGDLGEPQGSAVEWEEALLGAWGGEIPTQSAAYYRRRAARAREIAGGWRSGPLKHGFSTKQFTAIGVQLMPIGVMGEAAGL